MSRYNRQDYQDDRDSCQFFTKIGACRHGDKCSRRHVKPTRSRTIVCYGMWNNPKFLQRLEESGPNSNSNNDTKEEVAYVETPEDKENFDLVFKDVFLECSLKHGIVEDMVVCENTNPHLSGNVYIKFRDLDSAIAAQADFQDRYFDSRPVFAEFCGVRSFEDAICKMFRSNECDRGGLCNFMHVKQPSQGLLQELLKSQAKWSAERGAQRQRV